MKLEGIKPGDVLAISRAFGSGVDLHVVERLTNTQVITVNGTRVALKDGKVIGSTQYARIPTDKDILAHRIDIVAARLKKVVVTADNVDRVEAFLKGQS